MIPREGGNPRWAHVTDVKYVLPVDAVLDQMPLVSQAGRPSKLNIHPSREPDLGWTLATTLNTVHTIQQIPHQWQILKYYRIILLQYLVPQLQSFHCKSPHFQGRGVILK